jgi:hypothetical protein
VAEIVLGPLLRYAAATEATVWLELDRRCEVHVAGRRARTFSVAGHHYAIAVLDGLEPGVAHEYDVRLDGERVWPEEGSDLPPSSIRTVADDARLQIVFGSCRVAAPHEPPWTLSKDDDPRGREADALRALAQRLRRSPREEWPDQILMLGDQVYVDEDAPRTREFIRARRDTSEPPYEEVADFEEYTRLYRETWSDPVMRWLLSTVPSAMIFDDHDVHDDWNTSQAWLEEIEREPWWHDRIVGALVSYWIYQHLGNLSPAELDAEEVLRDAEREEDAWPHLRRFAEEWDHERNGNRFSHARTLGRTKLIVFDSREGRVLEEGRRRMFDDVEWDWICEQLHEDFDHLVLADTLPVYMPVAFHYVEAWNEAVCAGAWGRVGAWAAGERVRRALDLEHWSAFRCGFDRLCGLLADVGGGGCGPPPAKISLLAGDIHHAYLAEVALPRSAGARSAVNQLVCSPFRNPLTRGERFVATLGVSRPLVPLARGLARLAGVPDPPVRWRLPERPTFDNQFATLELDGRRARARIERVSKGGDSPSIDVSLDRWLTGAS